MTAEAESAGSVGLVPKVHNRTDPSERLSSWASGLTVWPEGSVVRIRRRVDPPSGGRRCKATKPDGMPCRNVAMCDSEFCAVHSGRTRSEVTEFSAASRRRMMHLLARISREHDALLVTLTWPTWAAPDAPTWHRSWDRFRVRLRRRFSKAGLVWRREFTEAGVVHLHLLVYGVKYSALRSWVPSAWADCVDAPNRDLRERVGTSVESVRAWRAVKQYVAKYCAKRSETAQDAAYGRWWGVCGEQNIPWAQPVREAIPDAVAMQLIRTARRFIAAERRRLNLPKARHAPKPNAGFTVLTCDPLAWSRLAALYCVEYGFT